jgi:hypothetical protein
MADQHNGKPTESTDADKLVPQHYQLPASLLARIEKARKGMWPDVPSKVEAVRRLLDLGLSSNGL